KDHNIAMRQRAKRRGEKINEYGVEIEKSGEVVQFETEEAFFNHFDLEFIRPEVRQDGREIERFESKVQLLEKKLIQWYLHMHTTCSDGAESIEDIVNAARDLGYTYNANNHHSKFLRVAN